MPFPLTTYVFPGIEISLVSNSKLCRPALSLSLEPAESSGDSQTHVKLQVVSSIRAPKNGMRRATSRKSRLNSLVCRLSPAHLDSHKLIRTLFPPRFHVNINYLLLKTVCWWWVLAAFSSTRDTALLKYIQIQNSISFSRVCRHRRAVLVSVVLSYSFLRIRSRDPLSKVFMNISSLHRSRNSFCLSRAAKTSSSSSSSKVPPSVSLLSLLPLRVCPLLLSGEPSKPIRTRTSVRQGRLPGG